MDPNLPTIRQRLKLLSPSRLVSLLIVLLAVGVAIAALGREGSQLLAQSIHLNPALVGLSFLVECSGLLVAIPAWRLILARHGIHQDWRTDAKIYNYSAVALVLPGGFWPIVSRTAFYQRLGESGMQVAIASLVETIVLGVASIVVYAISSFLRPDLSLWNRPEIGLALTLLALMLVYPPVFNRLVHWGLKKSGRGDSNLEIGFGIKDLWLWIGMEITVLLIGGLAVFTLLASLTPVSYTHIIPMIAAWAAASAAGTLFFWMPGTPILRDGAMVLVLSAMLNLPVALIFVVLVRLWSLLSLLVVAGLVWLFLDWPQRRKQAKSGFAPLDSSLESPESRK